MKSFALAVVGVFLAAMAAVTIARGDLFTIAIIGTGFVYWTFITFRTLRRRLAVTRPQRPDVPRPWQR